MGVHGLQRIPQKHSNRFWKKPLKNVLKKDLALMHCAGRIFEPQQRLKLSNDLGWFMAGLLWLAWQPATQPPHTAYAYAYAVSLSRIPFSKARD